MLKHYRGNKNKYSYNLQTPTEAHKDGLYFTTDKHEILMNGNGYGKNADTALVGKEILISEGPLANIAKTAFPSGKIPDNITIADVLTKLLCKTVYPSLTTTKATLTIGTPTITTSGVSPTATVVEVGTNLSVTFTGGSVTHTATSNSLTGFTHGYVLAAEDAEGNFIKPADGWSVETAAVSEAWTNVSFPTVGYTLEKTSCTGGLSTTSADTQTSDADTAISSISYTFSGAATAGSNYCKVTETTPVATGTVPNDIPAGKYYIVSNTTEISDSHKNSAVTNNVGKNAGDSYSTQAKTATADRTWTGVYPILSNGTFYSGSSGNNDALVNSTADTNSATLTKTTTLWSGSKIVYIKFPDQGTHKWRLGIPHHYSATTITASSYDILLAHNYTVPVTFAQVKDKDGNPILETAKCGDNDAVTYDYEIWECVGAQGPNGVQLTINLK